MFCSENIPWPAGGIHHVSYHFVCGLVYNEAGGYLDTWLYMSVQPFQCIAVNERDFIGVYSDDWTVFFMDFEDIGMPIAGEIANVLP